MKRFSNLFLAASALIGLGTLVGCGNGNEEINGSSDNSNEQIEITFTWWGSQERANTTNEAVKLFMEKNPDIKVNTSFYPFDSYSQNLNISATANKLADVFQGYLGTSDTNALIEKGKVISYDKFIEDGTVKVDNISKDVLQLCKYEDQTYGLPFGLNAKVMYVAPDVYEKAGLEIPEPGYANYDDLEGDTLAS